jgi:hypothetical protein
VLPVLLDHKDKPVLLDQSEQSDHKDQPDLRVKPERLVQPVSPDQPVLKDKPELPVQLELQVPLVQLVNLRMQTLLLVFLNQVLVLEFRLLLH